MSEESAAKFCLDCRYRLDYLAHRECPECGREFDPEDEMTWRREYKKKSWHVVVFLSVLYLGLMYWIYFSLTQIQYNFVAWWQGVGLKIGRNIMRHRGYWYPEGLGIWMQPMLEFLMLMWACIFSLIVMRWRLKRYGRRIVWCGIDVFGFIEVGYVLLFAFCFGNISLGFYELLNEF
ncbi:hypothetical protein JD969_00760 [Planctomycetota bacterium]|nr:hypothetical protein JD969_00760 [Planctomycetota bacterium]